MFAGLKHHEEGQGLVEYALILLLVGVVAIVILAAFGGTISNSFNCVVMSLDAIQGSPIVALTLADSTTDEPVSLLCGQNVDISAINGHLTIIAETKGSVGSVTLQLNGPTTQSRTESIYPYSLFGDTDGDFTGGTLSPGDYSLTATAYSEANGGGTNLGSATITFSLSA